MVIDIPGSLPPVLAAGAVLGAAATIVIVTVFVLGDLLLPAAHQGRARRDDGESRRHAQIQRYLQRIHEPFVERGSVDGVRVAFYLPARDVALTFDVRRSSGWKRRRRSSSSVNTS